MPVGRRPSIRVLGLNLSFFLPSLDFSIPQHTTAYNAQMIHLSPDNTRPDDVNISWEQFNSKSVNQFSILPNVFRKDNHRHYSVLRMYISCEAHSSAQLGWEVILAKFCVQLDMILCSCLEVVKWFGKILLGARTCFFWSIPIMGFARWHEQIMLVR